MSTESPKKPPLPMLFGHIAEWSGWEYLYEERRKVSAIVILIVCFLLGLGWLISQRESSSLGKLLRAEGIVATITNPENEESPSTIQKDVETLFSLSKNKEIAARFCGVLAQEEIIEKRKLSPSFFEKTARQASEEGSPIIGAIPQLSLLQEKGLKEESLQKIDEILPQSPSPWMSLYLLIQKAHILQELGRSNLSVVEELRTTAAKTENIEEFFDTRLHMSTNDFFKSLEHGGSCKTRDRDMRSAGEW